MVFLSLLTIITLIIAGLFHFYWALGGKLGLDRVIPTLNEKPLLNPGKTITIIVGLLLLSFAWIAYILSFQDLSQHSFTNEIIYMGWFLSILFFIRIVGDFNAVGLFKKIKSTKFAEFDTKYFIPLTLLWSLTFALLSSQI